MADFDELSKQVHREYILHIADSMKRRMWELNGFPDGCPLRLDDIEIVEVDDEQ